MESEQTVEEWRFASLMEAWSKQDDKAFTVEVAEALARVAAGDQDLHDACAALQAGCDPLTLERIFT
jgi:hypothetical protein